MPNPSIDPARRMPRDRQDEQQLVQAAKAERQAARDWHPPLLTPPNTACLDLFGRCKDYLFKHAQTMLAVHGLEQDDLANEGYLNFIDAVERYDFSVGVRFLTFVSWYMFKAKVDIRASASPNPTAARSHHSIDYKVKRVEAAMVAEGLLPDDDEEVARRLGWSRERLFHHRQRAAIIRPLVFDGSHEAELVVAPESPYEIEADLEVEALRAALKTLPDRDRQILQLRSEGVSLTAVGRRFGFTKERARQIQAKALAQLKTIL